MPVQVNRTRPSKPQFDIITSRKQVNLFLAGQGSGKTHIAGVISGMLITQFPQCRGFVGANTYTQLSDSTLYRIRQVWKELFNWTEYSKDNPRGNYIVDKQPPAHFNTVGHAYDTYRNKICFIGGTVLFKGSLENYKAHDGKEFAWALLDETKDTKEEAVKEVITGRLREPGMFINRGGELIDEARIDKDRKDGIEDIYESFNPLYIFTSPAKVQWLNEWFNLDEYAKDIVEKIYIDGDYFIKDIGNKRVTISSVYHNAHNLPDQYIPNQLLNLDSGRQDMLIFGNPFSNTGGEFYKRFNRQKNMIDVRDVTFVDVDGRFGIKNWTYSFNDGKRAYCSALPLHISFDFNLHPYMTCTVWQMVGKKVYQIDEICLTNPNNTTTQVCREFALRYHDHTAGLFVYGDPAGRHEDTRVDKHDVKGYNDYWIVMRELAKYKPSQRVGSAHPPVKPRGDFMNIIFEKGYDDIEIWIHDKCAKSISDYVYLKETSDGTKFKEKVIDPDSKVSYEKFGHTSDSGDYFICMAFANEFMRFQKGGAQSNKPTSGKPTAGKNSY